VGGIREAVTPEFGRLLSASADDSAYTRAVLASLKLRAENPDLAARAQAHVRAHFTKEKMCSALVSDLSSIAAELDREERLRDYELDFMTRPVLR
jgi:hypothetical protein